ncbi:MAG: hypothetical protein F6K41_15360 [Symploca sp. SIO3E6]|nr:hypothetical protein [Caldora sp. SIO3E6]
MWGVWEVWGVWGVLEDRVFHYFRCATAVDIFTAVTHIVCAEQQIHSQDLRVLRELADQVRIG